MSVGEVNLLAPLLKMIERERPEWECVISTTTATGMALAKKKYPRQTVFYCPLDFSWAVKTAMRRVRPDVLVLAELELWPNLIRAAKNHGAKVAVINGRLGEKSFRGYRRIRPLVARLLQQINVVAAQDETYAERFRALGARPETVHVTGSMKYDGAQTDRNNPATRRLARLAGFEDDDIVLLAGSTQEPEEAMALRCVPRPQSAMAPAAAGDRAASSRSLRGCGKTVGVLRHPLAATNDIGGRNRKRQSTSPIMPTQAWAWRPILPPSAFRPPPSPLSPLSSPLAFFWSMSSASWAPGGELPGSRLSAGAWAAAAGRT